MAREGDWNGVRSIATRNTVQKGEVELSNKWGSGGGGMVETPRCGTVDSSAAVPPDARRFDSAAMSNFEPPSLTCDSADKRCASACACVYVCVCVCMVQSLCQRR